MYMMVSVLKINIMLHWNLSRAVTHGWVKNSWPY